MNNWPEEVERVANLWERDCHEAVHGFDVWSNRNIHVSAEDKALPRQLYERMMVFATPSADMNDLYQGGRPGAGAFGVLTDVRDELRDARASLEKARVVTDPWSGSAADNFARYLIDLQHANEEVEDSYVRTLEMLIQTHAGLVNGLKEDLFDLQKQTLQALDGGGSEISIGKILVEGMKAAIGSSESRVISAVATAIETALEEGIVAAIDEFGSTDSYLQPYYDFGAGLLKLRAVVEAAVGAMRLGYDELARAIMSRRAIIEPSRPALVTAAAFDPADFMLPEYLAPTTQARAGQPAEYEIKPEYQAKIEPKISTDDVAVEEESAGPRGAAW